MHILSILSILNVTSQETFLEVWGYWFLFIASFIESFPFGILVPGQAILVMAGFFSRMNSLKLWLVMVSFVLGSLIGDMLNYHFARKYGNVLLSRFGKYILLKRKHFETIERVMKEHAGKAIFLGRLNPWTRPFIPLVSGISKLDFQKFFLYNILSLSFSVLFFVSLGYVFGEGYRVYLGNFEKLFIFFVFVLVVLFYIFLTFGKKRRA